MSEFAGTLRERVVLETRLEARDARGGATGKYSYDGVAWAALMPMMPGDLDPRRCAVGLAALAGDDAQTRRRGDAHPADLAGKISGSARGCQRSEGGSPDVVDL